MCYFEKAPKKCRSTFTDAYLSIIAKGLDGNLRSLDVKGLTIHLQVNEEEENGTGNSGHQESFYHFGRRARYVRDAKLGQLWGG